MEKQIKIQTSNKKNIYVILRGSLKKPLIVFVHGFTGDRNERQFFNGARYVEKQGFSSVRFNLYDWRKDARKLHECTLSTHAYDLDRVVKYFRKKGAKKIFVVGHSYGGKTILLSKDRDFEGVVLWDPSHNSAPLFKKAKRIKNPKGYIELDEAAYGVFVGDRMVKEESEFPWKEGVRNLKVPIRVIAAGNNSLIRGCKLYYKFANQPKSLVRIKGASHTFEEDGKEEKLFQETVNWLKKI